MHAKRRNIKKAPTIMAASTILVKSVSESASPQRVESYHLPYEDHGLL